MFLVEIPRNRNGMKHDLIQSKQVVTAEYLTKGTATSRLNAQHNLLTKVTENTLIHPSIPKEGLLNVADIATGTG